MFRPPHTVPFVLAGLCLAVGPVSAQTIDLASDMNPQGRITETTATESFAQINLDPDGLYNSSNESELRSTNNLFSNQTSFSVGSLTVDGSGVTGSGVEIAPVTGLDLSEFWSSGSTTTDINDSDSDGLGAWFFGVPRSFTFGSLDTSDTATFTDGLLTNLAVSTTAQFNITDASGTTRILDGTFSIVGSTISFDYNDAEPFDQGPFGGLTTFTFSTTDLNGTVLAVDTFVIPEPASMALLLGGLGLLTSRRRSA